MQILFVCLGNICRSPTAEGVMKALIKKEKLEGFNIDSAGTSDYHIGEAPDKRAQAAAKKRGYDISAQKARQFSLDDFNNFDHIFVMDDSNLENIQMLDPQNGKAKVSLLLDHASDPKENRNVPDPYWSEEDGFELVLDMIEDACRNFLKKEGKI